MLLNKKSLSKKDQVLQIKNESIAARHLAACNKKSDKTTFCSDIVQMIDNYWYFSSYEYLFEFFNFFVSFSSAHNQSFEALMVVLLPTIACIMDKSVVEISDSYVETCSVYAILVGYPSV
jgi:hypothetical protein